MIFRIILYSYILALSYRNRSYSSPKSGEVFLSIGRHLAIFDELRRISSTWGWTSVVKDEEKEDEGHHFSSLLAMSQLALNEQRIIVQMVKILDNLSSAASENFRNSMSKSMTEEVNKIQRYVRDYDDSIRPMLLKTSLPVNPLMHFSWPAIFKSEVDRIILQEIVSSHPLISFRMLRRIHKDLPEILGTQNTQWKLILERAYSEISPTVNEKDLIGAAEGVFRIQHIFNISALDLTNGKLMNFETGSGLKAVDACFIAKMVLVNKSYSKAIDWLERAFRMVKSGRDTTADANVLKDALLQTIDKHNDLLGAWNSQYQTFAQIVGKDLERWEEPRHHPVVKSELFTLGNVPMDRFNFEALCRGEIIRNPSLTKNLNCWYKRDNPYLIIKPLKAELHNEDPYIVQFYDILHDRAINHLKKLASPKLERSRIARVLNRDDKVTLVVSKVRISSNAWLQESGDEILIKVPDLIKEATGLNAYIRPASEPSEISAYGPVGGFYLFHYDTLFDPTNTEDNLLTPELVFIGDRLATVMFYLSDVKLGGGTAFPKIGVVSNAIKGSAMFWYNTKKNGKRDDLTYHGGCPVLYGQKWIVNKRIRGGSQMFIRKCSTNADE